MSIFLKFVLPALIAALVSFLVCFINNKYVLKVEKKRQEERVLTFRYQTLYNFLQASIGSPEEFLDPESTTNLLKRNLRKQFLFEREEYFKIRPLLEKSYIEILDQVFNDGLDTLEQLDESEEIADIPGATEEEKQVCRYLRSKFYHESRDAHEKLHAIVNQQIMILIKTIQN